MSTHLDRASVEAIAAELASLLERRPEPRQLVTAGQVAARFNVDRSWVYAHAQELGVVRLTESRRPRLRFDPAVVAQRLLAEQRPDPPRTPTRFVRGEANRSLLPIKGRRLDHDFDNGDL